MQKDLKGQKPAKTCSITEKETQNDLYETSPVHNYKSH